MTRPVRRLVLGSALAAALALVWADGTSSPMAPAAGATDPSHGPISDPGLVRTSSDASTEPASHHHPQVAELAGDLARLANRTGDWGVLAVSLDGGDTLVDLGGADPMVPASNMKLFTSAAALHHLGPDFRFPTWLLADGPVEDGVLRGDLLVYGTGDPTLGLRNPDRPDGAFHAFVEALRDAGVHTIAGDVVGDGTYFRGDPRRPSWNPDDLNDWFAAPVSALSFNENMVSVQVRARGALGAEPEVVTHPRTRDLPLENRARLVQGATRTPLAIVRDHPDDPIRVEGDLPRGAGDAWRGMSVSEPQRYAASVLVATLESAGIRVLGGADGMDARHLEFEAWGQDAAGSRVTGRSHRNAGGTGLRALAVHHSAPLPDLLHTVNHRSHNLYSEVLLKALGRQVEGDPSFEGGRKALTRYLVEVVGIEADEVHVEDGSGLSRLNRASPRALVRVLEHMARDPNGELFRASLPEAGRRQGLSRMSRSAAAGNLRAKTGTIHRVSALSGVVTTAGGEEVLFSIVANDVPSPWAAKRVEDEMGIRLASFSRPGVGVPPVASPQDGAPATDRAVNRER